MKPGPRALGLAVCLAAFAATATAADPPKKATEPPPGVQVITVRNTLDGAEEPVWFLPNPSPEPAPLLVHLHSWSSRLGEVALARDCAKRGWAFVSPNFRGPNNRPEACGSRVAIQDVLDAVAHARRATAVDPRRIYLIGGSGGGHMALMMAQAAPGIWAGVSAWVPITDLSAWHAFSKQKGSRYHTMMEQACGGPPGTPATDAEYRARSPLFFLERAKGVPIDLQVGIRDGHEGSVPVSHALRAFNALAAANGHSARALPAADIEFITAQARLPEALAAEKVDEPHRRRPVLFRRTAGPVRLTIFDGAHESDFAPAVRWLAEQSRPLP
ncbi:MAG: prolyl oligopeptidase family serine peptidase [Opitutaceae bacterium]|nr:prolyl oligopeptidase family serine peptidase [Opitutaceae bacterium]